MTEPIGVGLIGCGNTGLEMHLPAYLRLPQRYRLLAVADPTEARREMARAAPGLPRPAAVADYRDLLARQDVDLVDVTTPPALRPEIVLAALEAGKHVLAEKPLATVPAQAAEMVEAARGRGRMLAVNHNYLFLPENLAIRGLLEEGAIGRVEVAIQNFLGVVDRPGAPEYRPLWRHQPGAGGGVLMDMVHCIYLSELYLGQPIRAVNAVVDRRLSREEGVEDLALCRFEFDEGLALVNMAWGLGPGGIALMGTAGRILVHYQAYGTCSFQPLVEIVVIDPAGRRREVPFGPREDFLPYLSDLATRLEAGRPPAATGEDGLRVLEAAMATYASAARDRTVTLPLSRDDPLYRRGLAGLREQELSPRSLVVRKGLFGVA